MLQFSKCLNVKHRLQCPWTFNCNVYQMMYFFLVKSDDHIFLLILGLQISSISLDLLTPTLTILCPIFPLDRLGIDIGAVSKVEGTK